MNTKLRSKVCIITGASRGIGLAIAKDLYENGASIVICSHASDIIEVARKISRSKKKLLAINADITKEIDVERLVRLTLEKFGRIDILVNNAGVFKPFGLFEKSSFALSKKAIETNLIGTMACCYFAIPYMKRQKYGRIINLCGGGIGGDIALVNAASYFISKGGVAIMTEVLGEELKPHGVTINSVLPGQILTQLTREVLTLPGEQLGPVLNGLANNLKSGGEQPPIETLKLIKFLVSDKASHVTGRLLSAKWDSLEALQEKLDNDKYKLRRIEGNLYTKVTWSNKK